jgi:hypothetical protein
MAGTTRCNLSGWQGFTFEGVSERKQSTLPMHGTAELGKGLEAAIKRQLDLK